MTSSRSSEALTQAPFPCCSHLRQLFSRRASCTLKNLLYPFLVYHFVSMQVQIRFLFKQNRHQTDNIILRNQYMNYDLVVRKYTD